MAASPAAMIDAESLVKIRTLFAAGTADGVSLGLTLLESLGATAADFDAALAPPVERAVAAVADGWLRGGEYARGEYDRYYRLVVAPRFGAQREADRAAGRSFLKLFYQYLVAATRFCAKREAGCAAGRAFLELVEIPAGEFVMGGFGYDLCEYPVHRVRITRAFLLGKTPVTQGQWWSVMGTQPWQGQDHVKEGAAVAATYVSWEDAVEFCTRLTKLQQASGKMRDNERYRLPTEAEWEYACRAGTKTVASFGDDAARLGEFAWFDGNANDAGEKYAHEVGQKKPNPWGLHDMHGNVDEWCSDWYDGNYYRKSPAADPEGPSAGSDRVVRGGSWRSYPIRCRSASRNPGEPARRCDYGFRVVFDLG